MEQLIVAGHRVAGPAGLLVTVDRPVRAPVQSGTHLLGADIHAVHHETSVAAEI